MKISKIALFNIGSFAVLGTIFSLSAPLLFVAYLDEGIISESAIGLMSSLNLFGLVIGCLSSLYCFRDIPLLKLARTFTFLIALLCWFCSLLMESWTIYPNLLLLGFFQGLLYARTFSSFANLPNPTEGYAMYQFGLSFFGILCFYAIPRLIPIIGIHAGFYIISCIALFSFLISLIYSSISFGLPSSSGISFSILNDRKLIGLLVGIMLFQAADMSIWVYLERIAHLNDISTSFVSWVLIFAFLAGMFIAWVVDKLSVTKGFRLPLILGMFTTLLMLIRLQFPMNNWEYAIVNVIFNMAWVLTYTYMLSLQANYDKSGKLITIGVAANFVGEGLGPFLTGSLLLFFPLIITSWVAILLLTLSGIFILPILSKNGEMHENK